MKIRQVGAELFNVDGQTDIKLTVTLSNFVNEPKNGWMCSGVSSQPSYSVL
jgi:hypothetical protein